MLFLPYSLYDVSMHEIMKMMEHMNEEKHWICCKNTTQVVTIATASDLGLPCTHRLERQSCTHPYKGKHPGIDHTPDEILMLYQNDNHAPVFAIPTLNILASRFLNTTILWWSCIQKPSGIQWKGPLYCGHILGPHKVSCLCDLSSFQGSFCTHLCVTGTTQCPD